MPGRIKQFLFLGLFFVSNFSFSQTKEELKKQKIILENEIKNTTELLNKTQKNKETSLTYLKGHIAVSNYKIKKNSKGSDIDKNARKFVANISNRNTVDR